MEKSAIKLTVYEHGEFTAFIRCMNEHFGKWRECASKDLKKLERGYHPKEVIARLSENLLAHYDGQPLIDKYDVYQHLMDYWAETMQDDCYLIAADRWKAETAPILENRKGKEVVKGWTCDLVPKGLIMDRYFAAEKENITGLETELEMVSAQIAEGEEEGSGEEGAFSGLDKINKATVAAELKRVKSEEGAEEDAEVLDRWLKLNNKETALKRALKDAEATLDRQAYNKYPTLTEAEIQALVVDDKWLGALDAAIHGEMDRISQALTQRVKELAERYETPMPQGANRVAELEQAVNRHLERMGFSWN